MKLNRIMVQIGMGLTGDSSQDIVYLQNVMKKYKNHKYKEEIFDTCTSLIFEILPKDKQKKIEDFFCRKNFGVEGSLEEVKAALFLGRVKEAKGILERTIDKIEDSTIYEGNECKEYYSFNEPMEVAIYKNIYKPKKQIEDVGENFAKVYFIYAKLLKKYEKIEKVREGYKKALVWNPVDVNIILAYAETYRTNDDLKNFYEITKEAFKVAYKQEQLAKCYTNFGDYFLFENNFETAKGCYLLALQAYNNKDASKGIAKIDRLTNDSIKDPDFSMLKLNFNINDLSLGANEDIIKIAFRYGKQFIGKKEFGLARYFLKISYDLTKNEKLKRLLEEIPNEEFV